MLLKLEREIEKVSNGGERGNEGKGKCKMKISNVTIKHNHT